MDTDPRTTPEALADFNEFYNTTHVHEVIAAHPGFVGVSRYELLDAQQHAGPRWLAVYEMADEAAAEQYLKDNARPWLHRKKYSPWPSARRKARTVWRMLWRQVSTTGSIDHPPESILIVGMNTPEISEHPEFARATCFELFREFAHPAPGSPRFCIVYEDSTGDQSTQEPQVAWRLAYRRIPLVSS